MTENKSLLVYARLAARLKDFMSLRGLPSALFGIYICVVLRLFFILSVLCAVKNKFTLLPYAEACNEFVGPISTSLRLENTAPFKKKCCSD